MKIKTNFKRVFSGILSLTMMSTLLPYLPANAETLDEKYPYTLFAGSSEEGAITINADNIGINGNVATNGSIVSTANNFNVNGTKTEYAEEEMIYCFKKLDYAYFTGTNVNFYADDYSYEDTNININTPLDVGGEIELTGNINLNTGIKAVEDVTLNGDVKNTNESVICSETGDIIIETNNVNLNGLVYAPEGCVEITAQNLNMNNVVIIADTIIINCPNLNANYSNSMAEFVGTESEVELEMFAFAQYTADTNTINIEWSSTVPKGTFDIQISDDNITYTSIGTVTNDTCYDYGITEEFEKRYFKITETTYYGEVGSSIPFVAVKTTDGYEIQLLDTEEDGVPDIFENMYGTDINNPDTDKDNLTDYEEIYLTNSDPTVYNSVNENLSDADADSDEDGISNIEEIKLETNPLLPDTDSDDISDYDELYIYFTDPLNPDTDDDTISDGDELKLGLDPSNPQTFGIPDAEYKTTQNISADSETLSDINTEENPYKLSIDITAAGYAPNSMDASISGYTNTLSDNSSIIGNVVSLEYIDTAYENVTLNFEMDSAYLNNMEDSVTENLDLEGINRLHVFRYDKEYNILYPVETTINNNTLTVNTSELGDYCIVDLDAWLNLLGIELTATETYDIAPASAEIEVYSEETVNPESTDEVVVVDETVPENYEELVEENIEEAIAQIAEDTPSVATFSLEDTSTILSAKHKIDLVYVIDTSGSMGSILSTAKSSMSNLVNSLNAAGIDVNVAVISYDEYININSNTTKTYYTNTNSPWANTPEDASDLINQVYLTNGGWETPLDGLGMAHKLNYHPNATKFMVLITDEPYLYSDNRYGITSMQEMADMLKADDIYTSVVCYNWDSSGYAPLYTTTNGININLSSDWVTYLEEYIRTYIRDLKTFKAVVPNSLTTISLNETPVYGAEVNSDEDSLWDYEEIDWTYIDQNSSELVLPTLVEYTMNITGTNAFDTLPIAVKNIEKLNSIVVLPLLSNPTKADSDDDSLNDDKDAEKLKCFDKRFTISENYTIMPNVDFVNEEYKKSKSLYLTDTDVLNETKNLYMKLVTTIGASIGGTSDLTSLMLTFLHKQIIADNQQCFLGAFPNASELLKHYLLGTGNTYILNNGKICDSILSSSKNVSHLKANLQDLITVAEQTTLNSKITLTSKSDAGFMSACYLNKGYHCNVNHSSNPCFENPYSTDWYHATGEAFGGMTCEVINTNNIYKMTFRYYLIDIYEWIPEITSEPNISNSLHELHKAGQAQDFLMNGYFESTITWVKGEGLSNNIMKQVYRDMLLQMEENYIILPLVSNYDNIIGDGSEIPDYNMFRNSSQYVILK